MIENGIPRRQFLSGAAIAGLGALTVGTETAGADRPDGHIVGTSTPATTEAVKRRALTVKRVLDFGDIGQAVAGTFSDEALQGLARNPNVRYIEDDGTMEALAQTLPWGVDRVDADIAHGNGYTGGSNDAGDTNSGADIAILDTGIDSDHPDLQANIGSGTAFVGCKGGPKRCRYSWDDDDGHGTHCAGIADAVDNSAGVVGVSTAATLHAVKVLDNNGRGAFSDVAAGIEYVADQGWDVGSMSLGASSGSQTVKDACRYAYDRGVLLVAAAGNSGPCTGCVGYPAAYATVVAVSATETDDSLAGYSSTGPEVELAAPGSGIYSTYAGGGYETLSGTSMACPHVSGAAAQLMDNGDTNTQARDTLTSSAEDLGLPANDQGNGLLDVAAALGLDSSDDLGDTNSAPSVSWQNPTDGATVSDAVSIEIAAADSDGSISSVEFSVDGSTISQPTDGDGDGVYTDTWDSTTVSDGDHTLTADATDDDGASASASITVTVANGGQTGENAPTVDSLSLAEDNHGGSPHAEFDAAWRVSDADGDLDTVELTLTDTDTGVTEDSASVDVSGFEANGTTGLTAKFDENNGDTYQVTLIVTDSRGNASHDTASEIEDGS